MSRPPITFPLTNSGLAIVDAADWAAVGLYKWRSVKRGRCFQKTYVETTIDGKNVHLHRFLMGAQPGQVVDHINGDGLDNRRSNLRVCSQRENSRNRRGWGRPLKGAAIRKDTGRWRARIMVDGQEISLGCYGTEREALATYDIAAREHFGEFALLNGAPPSRTAPKKRRAA
jgi:hypothetical protein